MLLLAILLQNFIFLYFFRDHDQINKFEMPRIQSHVFPVIGMHALVMHAIISIMQADAIMPYMHNADNLCSIMCKPSHVCTCDNKMYSQQIMS